MQKLLKGGELMKKLLTFFAVAALISFATGAAADPNTFDANGNLCLIGTENNTQEIGTPMELWVEPDLNCCTEKKLAGLVTFNTDDGTSDNGTVIINLTDVDNDGFPDMYPYVATAVHIHFADTLNGIPHYNTGDPRLARFEYTIDDLDLFEYIVEIDNPFQSEIVIPVDFQAVGAIHLKVEKDYSDVEELADWLPDGLVDMRASYPHGGDPSYLELTLSGAGLLDGVYESWCVDVDKGIQDNMTYTAYLYSSYEDLTGLEFEHPENFDKVNYLLNNFYVGVEVMPLAESCSAITSCGAVVQEEALTYGDIEVAIWTLIEDTIPDDLYNTAALGPWSQDRVNAILCDVNANGENYIPGCYEETVFIVAPTDGNTQLITGQTQISTLGIPCETVCSSNAWGDGFSGEEFDGTLWGTYFNYEADCEPLP
jgi:hypothetical protein